MKKPEDFAGTVCCLWGGLDRNTVAFLRFLLERDLSSWWMKPRYRVQEYANVSGLIHGIQHCERHVVLVILAGGITESETSNLIIQFRDEHPTLPVILIRVGIGLYDLTRAEFLAQENLARSAGASMFQSRLIQPSQFTENAKRLIKTGHQPIPWRRTFWQRLLGRTQQST